jgi:hypothetical protein
MRFWNDLSTGALMRLIILIALQLVLFQGVWSLVLDPRITMMVVALNLGLYLVVIRPRHLNTPAVGMMIAALIAVLAVAAYSAVRFRVPWPPVVPGARRWVFNFSVVFVSVGVLGRLFLDFLSGLLSVPPDTKSAGELMVLQLGRWVPLIESVLLDLVGLTVILAGARYGGRSLAAIWHQGEFLAAPSGLLIRMGPEDPNMSETVTIELPDELSRRARRLAAAANRRLEDVVIDWISQAVSELDVESLPDDELLKLCDATLGAGEQEELSNRLADAREGTLDAAERARLDALMAHCRRGLVLKACAWRAAVARGLWRPPTDTDADTGDAT